MSVIISEKNRIFFIKKYFYRMFFNFVGKKISFFAFGIFHNKKQNIK